MTLIEPTKKPTPKYTAELRARGVRLYREPRSDYTSDNAADRAIASKLGCSHETLRAWCIQAAREAGGRAGPTTEDKARLKALERENRELRTANEILKKGAPVKAPLVRARWRTPILRRRSSTARSANDRPHRRASQGFRGQAIVAPLVRATMAARSAVFCRSPRQPSIAMPLSRAIPSLPRTAPGRTLWTSRRSRRPTARAGGAMVPANSGIDSVATGTTSRVALWSGSCIFTACKGLCVDRRRQPSPIQRSLARMTRSTGSSSRRRRTSSGSPM